MQNLIGLLHAAVERHGERDALMWKSEGHYRKMTYDGLWQRVQSFAYGLQAQGVAHGTKVAILSNNRPEWLIADFAVLSLGAVSVPVYPTLTAPQIGFILQNADVELVIAENVELVEKAFAAASDTVRLIVHIDRLEALPEQTGPALLPFDALVRDGLECLEADGPLTAWEQVDKSDLATIVHTSGTTGNPKGVMLSHENLRTNAESVLLYVPVRPEDRSLSYLPLSHIFERTCGQFAFLSTGACMAFAENLNTIPENLLEVTPTLMTSVPRLFEKIYDGVQKNIAASSKVKQWLFRTALKIGKRHTADPTPLTQFLYPLFDRLVFEKIRAKTGGRLRLLVSGGGSLSPYIAEFFRAVGLPVCEGYGLTESAPIVSTNPVPDIRIGTVGRPLKGIQVRIADDGEVLVKGPNVMIGYYKNPQATADSFNDDGWLCTGDIGRFEDGYLKIVERKKNILVLATGKNVAPFPVESALSRSPFLSQAVLFGDKRKYVTALLVPDFQVLSEWAAEQDLALPLPDLLADERVQDLYAREIDKRLQDFASFERPKKFTLLPRELTLEDGELTATLKVRTHVLEKQFASEIEDMYREREEIAADTARSL
ncbi:long-chain fatty acid--CoA ligase [Tumebacillus sp. DT12]|uniref:Long-chain fatty acid--CoA ligase n=1 Tax=Tumebacillus lacus TaxID=2995335 RepID=A0ABT3WYP2_9BACL|nr:long-chain fatty acid--CoA ligase [Tumebacillus lacus]MCX7569777.1 long-chain fatty acid--CoA ligase [Tumebacillus lacus]